MDRNMNQQITFFVQNWHGAYIKEERVARIYILDMPKRDWNCALRFGMLVKVIDTKQGMYYSIISCFLSAWT